VESYQTSPDGYRAVYERAAIGAIAPRAQIGVAGNDRAAYLQGLLTNDIPALTAGAGCYSAWLTPQGRMLTDLHVFESGDMMLLDVPADQLEPTLQRLDQFLFSEDVQLANLSESLRGIWVHGPGTPAIIEKVVGGVSGLAGWADYRNQRGEFSGAPAVVARVDQLGVPGFCVYVAPSEEGPLLAAFRDAGAISIDASAIAAARIEAGYPVFGVDMTEETIPLEAGIEQRAISFTKGCYVGQEVIIRVLHRGHGRVAKKLMALRVAGDVPAAGAKLFGKGREVGVVTSAARSPRHGVIALGYLHRDFTAPGTGVEVDVAGERVTAKVTERPIPSAA
jgi:tRNA-modifying protein YgfZ